MKDHKENFQNNPTCRLINPTKSELGKVSKQKLAKVVAKVKEITGFNQWKNTDSVLSWFKVIPNKANTVFINFDIDAFYPSITEDLLNKALDYAQQFVTIPREDRELYLHTKSSILYSGATPWVKKENSSFDVTMGSYDGAETCDLVGLYLLSQLQHLRINVGLYRDDGLAAARMSRRQVEKVKQEIIGIFNNNGLKITIEVNKTVVNFLDVTLDLENNTFKPYMKPNNTPLYINTNSNHPPTIVKNIPLAVNRRLNKISSSEEVFNAAAVPYQEALDRAGHTHQLTYQPPQPTQPQRRTRSRQVTWFNPPFSKTISTKVGQKFLQLIDSCFPPGHPLRKVVNRSTVKVSYRTMPNMAQVVAQHNVRTLNTRAKAAPAGCGCTGGVEVCPLEGHCKEESVVYGAEVTKTEDNSKETYTGLTGGQFKKRWFKHKYSFEKIDKRTETTLSQHIWKLKEKDKQHRVTWKILAKARTFNPSNQMCRLCLKEKFFIMFHPETASLNSRSEVFSSCRHRASLLLQKFKPEVSLRSRRRGEA